MKHPLVAMLMLAGVVGCRGDAIADKGVDYRNLTAGYSMPIPVGWQATHGYGDVDLLLQPESDQSSTRISVQWDHRPDKKAVSLDDYQAFRLTRLSHFGKDRELIRQEIVALNEAIPEALQLEYKYQIGPGHKVHTRSWLFVSHNSQYTISLTAPPQDFAKMEATWQNVQQGFRLIP